MPSTAYWSGSFPALTTPFNADLSINYDQLRAHLEVLIDSGVKGFVMMGSLGENLALTWEEKFEILRVAREVSAGRVAVLSGVADTSTAQAADYSAKCAALGIDGIMLMPAMVYKADRDELITHFTTVAKASDLPILLYNNPLAYPGDLTPEILETLCDASDRFVALKESSGDTRRFLDIQKQIGDRLALFAGVDDLALECAFLGAVGWVMGIGLAFPYENQRLWDLAMAGKWDEARELYKWFSPVAHLDVGIKFVQNIKLATATTGYCAEYVRLPRLPLVGAERARIQAVIDEAIANRPSL